MTVLNVKELSKVEITVLNAIALDQFVYYHRGDFYPHYVDDRDACADWHPARAGSALQIATALQLSIHNDSPDEVYCTRSVNGGTVRYPGAPRREDGRYENGKSICWAIAYAGATIGAETDLREME